LSLLTPVVSAGQVRARQALCPLWYLPLRTIAPQVVLQWRMDFFSADR
jgi:hypothetical protein